MMAAQRKDDRLLPRLPEVRGRYDEAAALAGIAWFRVGGPAEVLFQPADRDDLMHFLAARPEDVPLTVIGAASNLLIRDGGIDGVVIRLGRALAAIRIEGEVVRAGAGAMDIKVALAARDAGLAGLEFLSGVPGSIGGALKMNAGAYGREIKGVLIDALAVDGSGRLHRATSAELGLGYRHSQAPEDWVFLEGRLQGRPEAPETIAARMSDIKEARAESQPVGARTGGSTFKNPPGETAWELIDRAGCRGLRRGGAEVSEQHCNFLINTGGATAGDLEALGEEVRRRVRETTGVTLEWEIRRLGRHHGAGVGEVGP